MAGFWEDFVRSDDPPEVSASNLHELFARWLEAEVEHRDVRTSWLSTHDRELVREALSGHIASSDPSSTLVADVLPLVDELVGIERPRHDAVEAGLQEGIWERVDLALLLLARDEMILSESPSARLLTFEQRLRATDETVAEGVLEKANHLLPLIVEAVERVDQRFPERFDRPPTVRLWGLVDRNREVQQTFRAPTKPVDVETVDEAPVESEKARGARRRPRRSNRVEVRSNASIHVDLFGRSGTTTWMARHSDGRRDGPFVLANGETLSFGRASNSSVTVVSDVAADIDFSGLSNTEVNMTGTFRDVRMRRPSNCGIVVGPDAVVRLLDVQNASNTNFRLSGTYESIDGRRLSNCDVDIRVDAGDLDFSGGSNTDYRLRGRTDNLVNSDCSNCDWDDQLELPYEAVKPSEQQVVGAGIW
jgi:hypothetical protein